MKTGFCCEYELKDTTAIEDSTLTTQSNQEFAAISKAKDNIAFPEYGTLEQDYFLLDGSMSEMPYAPTDIVYFSKDMSGVDGTFVENPSFVVDFSENHTSYGITLHFVGDYPLEMSVQWMNLQGSLLSKKDFVITDRIFFAQNQVENYGRLRIEFTKAKPKRYVKFYYMEYGTNLLFGHDGFPVKDAQLIEEADIISDKISINKITFKVIDEDNNFNAGNYFGIHKVLQKGQKMRAYENIDEKKVLLGRYFYDSSKEESNIINFSAVDYMGLLDNYTFRDGLVYSGELAGSVIDSIMATAGIADYVVDDETQNTPLYGWLKIQTCRKALREVLFACGSTVDTSRSEHIRIFKTRRLIHTEVKRTRKFSSSTIVDSYVSDVSIKIAAYTVAEEMKEIAKGNYDAGTHTIEFNSPCSELTINTGTIAEQNANYVTFTLLQAADVVISGKKYEKEDLTVTASVAKAKAGENRTAKSFTGTLLDLKQAKIIADKILDYYSLQLTMKIKFLSGGDKITDWGEIENSNKEHGNFVAGFEKMTTDLTSGFITTAELRGYYKELNYFDYMNELYIGEEMGDM